MIALATLTALVLTKPPLPGLEQDFNIALGMAGLTTESARFDKGILTFYRQGDGASSFFDASYDDPWRIPLFVDMNRRLLVLAMGQPSLVVESASRLLGQGSRRSLMGDPAASAVEKVRDPNAFGAALDEMKKAGLIKGAVPSFTQVPKEAQKAAAILIYSALGAIEYRRAAFSGVTDLPGAFTQTVVNAGEPSGPLAEKRQISIQGQCDMKYMYAGAQDMAAAVSAAGGAARVVPQNANYEFKVETEWGRIELSGGKDTLHDGAATFICIDTSGNDTYVNTPCNSTLANWCSVSIDTQGDDKYLSDPALAKTPIAEWTLRAKQKGQIGPGAALFGLTFLIDQAGDDLYRSARTSFGSAVFGVAYLGDQAGSDTYDSYCDSQGFGHYGIGALDDTEGDDKYLGFSQVQGVGLPHGIGLLLDRSGSDTYDANDKILDFPSAQSADHNNSMSQGAGYGFRADYLTGHSQSGGIGLLFDAAGKDSYSCGVFGQGVGYWEGVGMLWDAEGNDKYTGQWYTQGASAHFGIGYLEDQAGNDSYTALMNMAQGAGHDFAIGMLLDREGSDTYQAPNLSLGAGNANGIGVFVDFSGDDRYSSSGITLGSSAEAQKSSLRERALSLGMFLDLGGNDTYPEASIWAKNGSRTPNWNTKNENPAESQVGLFLDR